MSGLVEYIHKSEIITPQVVWAYAALTLTDDDHLPITPAPHHKLWMELICDWRIKKLLIIAPPESAKTTWALSAFIGCYVGFFPEHSVIIGSVSDDVAEKRSLSVRNMVETPLWQTIFPNTVKYENLKWAGNEWSLKDSEFDNPGRLHPTVRAYGTGSSITGSRADLMLGDDLLDFDNTRTHHQRQLIEAWLHNSFLPRRKSRTGRVILIGTSWNAGDMYATIRKEDTGWVTCHVPLLSEVEGGFWANVSYPSGWKYKMLGEPA
jgi:hypothetical protein